METPGSANGVYRLACERCRKQKLGCQWSRKEPGYACDRCANTGVPCETNTARRVGRPPRHRHHTLRQETPGLPVPPGTRPGVNVGAYRRDLRPFTPTTTAAPSALPPQCVASAPGPSALDGVQAAVSGFLPAEFVMDFDGEDSWLDPAEANGACLTMAAHGQDPITGHDDQFQFVSAAENGTLYENCLPGDASLPQVPPAPAPSALPTPASVDMPTTRTTFGQPAMNSAGPENCHVQLARLSAVLFAMPPNSNAKQTTQRGLWVMLVPSIVAHMKTLQGILTQAAAVAAAASEATSEDGGEPAKVEHPVMDSPAWLLQLSCFTRVIQICRLVLASLRRSLETNSDLVRETSLEGTIIQDDEPGLKVFVLVQILSYRIDALAVAMNLPERHRLRCAVSASPASTRSTFLLSIPSSTTDSILEGGPAERSVFGSVDDRKETILEAFRTECEALIALAA